MARRQSQALLTSADSRANDTKPGLFDSTRFPLAKRASESRFRASVRRFGLRLWARVNSPADRRRAF